MTNTWLSEMITRTNERLFSDEDLTRMTAYYETVPARLKLSEELERIEPGLTRPLHTELTKRYPDRTWYTRRAVQDLVEGVRHVNQAVLADDTRLMRHRWVSHLSRAAIASDLDPVEVRDVYLVLRESLEKQLSRTAWETLRPVYDEMIDGLTTPFGGASQ